MVIVNNLDILHSWRDIVDEHLQAGQSLAFGFFNLEGELLFANNALCYFFDTTVDELKPKNVLVNPVFSSFLKVHDSEIVFQGMVTIGNLNDISFVLDAKVYRRADEVLMLAEVNVPSLFEENRKMSSLNQEVNNLQRQLIKEKIKLEQTLNELKDTQQMLIHSEKMNAIGKLVAGVAHELNNPIAYVYSNLFSTEQYVADLSKLFEEMNELVAVKVNKEWHAAFDEIIEKYKVNELIGDIVDMTKESKMGIERVRDIVQDLRSFSRLDESDIKTIDLIENIKSTINIARAGIVEKKILFQQNGPDVLKIECYPGQLNQAIMNVLVNAIDAVALGGEIKLLIEEAQNEVIISISDNGKGFNDEVKKRAFEPFYTTKAIGSGVGLGLSISYKIICDLHKGTIELNSAPNVGTTVKLKIPMKVN